MQGMVTEYFWCVDPSELGVSSDVGYKEDLHAVHLKIDRVAEELRGLKKPSVAALPRLWYERHAGLIVLVAAAAQVFAVILMVIFWAIPHIEKDIRNDLSSNIENVLKDRNINNLPQQVSALAASVAAMRHDLDLLLQKELKIASSLPQESFNRNLDVVAIGLRLAAERNVPLERLTVQGIRQKLLASSPAKSNSYWNATGQWVTYRSKSNAGDKSQVDINSMAVCISGPGTMTDVTFDANFQCKFVLDGQRWLGGMIQNAFVIYHGGPVVLKNLQLKNCYFIIDLKSQPPSPNGQGMLHQLLASDISNITFNETG
jgi:nitrogen fixation-related uncharacterized protein